MIRAPLLREVMKYGRRGFHRIFEATRNDRGMLGPMWGHGSGRTETLGLGAGTANYGTTLTANATVGNDGAYTDIGTPTFQYHGIFITLMDIGGPAGRGMVEISIGAAAAEQITIQGIPFHSQGANGRGTGFGFYFPIEFHSGTLIRGRIRRSNVASATIKVALIGIQHPGRFPSPFRRCSAYGLNADLQGGTVVDPGATANTRGTVTQLVASTGNPIKALVAVATRDGFAVSTTNAHSAFAVYRDSGGNNAIVSQTPSWAINSTTDINTNPRVVGPVMVNMPSAVGLWAAAWSDNVTAGVRESRVFVWGFD